MMELTSLEKQRYQRHLSLAEIAIEGQLKLKKAKVIVIGAGGLGCPILQYLCAAGVGRIGIVDPDRVDLSNLQRQILYTTADIGMPKVEAAKKRLLQMNPEVKINSYFTAIQPDNACELLRSYDLVIDGSDNFSTRYLVNDTCVYLGLPLVFGAIYKFSGQVSVFNYQGSGSYRCLFPSPPNPDSMPNCSVVGVLGVLPGIIGSLQANEALKLILELGETLANQLLSFDALDLSQTKIRFKANTKIIEQLKSPNFITSFDYAFFCGVKKKLKEANKSISPEEFVNKLNKISSLQVVDVRELHEQPRLDFLTHSIPLPALKEELDALSKDKDTYIFCQGGKRSLLAQEILQELGFKTINITGGAAQIKSLL